MSATGALGLVGLDLEQARALGTAVPIALLVVAAIAVLAVRAVVKKVVLGILLTAIALAVLASPLAAQQGVDAATQDFQQRLEESLAELAALEASISPEKVRLNRRLAELEAELRVAQDERQAVAAARETAAAEADAAASKHLATRLRAILLPAPGAFAAAFSSSVHSVGLSRW